MTNSIPARADRRALFGAAALGSCLGLALGGAYIVGGLARAADASVYVAEQAPELRTDPGDALVAQPASSTVRKFNSAKIDAVPRVPPFALRASAGLSRDQDCLSQAVYYEARGEGDDGMAAVAQVVLNRVRHPRFPKSVCAVVFQHAGASCQFSFACDGSVRRRVEPASWRRAERVASRALAGAVMADVGAATDFRVAHIKASGLMRVAQIGSHVFYRFAGRMGHASALTESLRPSTAPRPVMAGFSPPAAEQILSASVKVVERAAAAVSAPAIPSAAPAQKPAPVTTLAAQAPVVQASLPSPATAPPVSSTEKPAVVKAVAVKPASPKPLLAKAADVTATVSPAPSAVPAA